MSGLDEELTAAEAETSGRDPLLVELERLAAEVHQSGLDFTIEHGRVVARKSAHDVDLETALTIDKHKIRLGIVSDTHGGSKYEQLTALHRFYRWADDSGVDAFIHVGDMTQGPDRMHRDQYLNVHCHGADAQVDYVAATYPVARSGAKTYAISGNHDDSFLNEGGTNVVRRISAKRPDIVYVGQDAAYFTINGLRMYLIHPDGGGAYAKTYKLQKIAATIPVEKQVALLLVGHYHNYATTIERETYAIQLPCFQGQYSWLARKALHPDIGGIVIDLWIDDAGRLDRIAHEFARFPTIDDDWDHQVSDELSRAWSPGGLEA